jgi:ADP-ribose pyrophosphatase
MKLKPDVLLKTTKFLNLVKTEAQTIAGNTLEWVWAQRPGSQNAAMIVPLIYDEGEYKLVLIKEFRIPLKDYEWGFPAGLIDDGEDPVETARRELREETGLTVIRILWKTPPVYNSAGMTDEAAAIVCVEAAGKLSEAGQESSEEIHPKIFGKDQIRELLKDPSNKFGAKAYLMMLWFLNDLNILGQDPLEAPADLNQLF